MILRLLEEIFHNSDAAKLVDELKWCSDVPSAIIRTVDHEPPEITCLTRYFLLIVYYITIY